MVAQLRILKNLLTHSVHKSLKTCSNPLLLIAGKNSRIGVQSVIIMISIYFADPGTLSQRGLNEHSNGLLRKDGLPKQMDFNQIDQGFLSSVASRRNHISRKSLDYQTPLEVFLSYMNDGQLSSLF